MKKILTGLSVAGSSILLAGPSFGQDTRLELGVGVDYISGEFGLEEETTILEMPFTARLKTGRFALKVRVPYATIEGPGGVVPGDVDDSGRNRRGRGSGVSGGDRPESEDDDIVSPVSGPTDASGLGDISIAASYSLDLGSSSYLDIIGRASLPTGDEESDLGLGETDYMAGAEIGRDGDTGGVYAFGGYKFRGGAAREDGFQSAIGGYRILADGVLLGVETNLSEPSFSTAENVITATAYSSFRLSDAVRLSGYVETGLSDNAPDFGAGAKITWRTNFRRPFQRQ